MNFYPLTVCNREPNCNKADPKERGRMVELFYLQAEKGEGINPGIVDVAIKRYHAKITLLEAKKAEEKLK